MELSFQEQMIEHHCWGCGTLNAQGLQIKSYWSGDEAVCTWQPAAHYMAGPKQVLNGGIIATVIDCHSVCTAIAGAYRAENRAIGSDPLIWCVTGALNIDYLRPTQIDTAVTLNATIEKVAEKKTHVKCTLFSGGKACVRAKVVAVRVPLSWVEKFGLSLKAWRSRRQSKRYSDKG